MDKAFQLSADSLKRLDAVKDKTASKTRAEVVSNALKVYEWLSEIDPDSEIRIVTPSGATLLLTRIRFFIEAETE